MAVASAPALAQEVVISNFSAGIGTGTAFGTASTTQHKAFGFTMGEAYTLDAVLLSMNFPEPDPTIEVSIWDGATIPQSQLITLDNPPDLIGAGEFEFTPAAPFTLEAGETYWVYVSPVTVGAGSSYTWDGTSPSTMPSGVGATAVGYIFNGSPSTFLNRLEVQGTPDGGTRCYADCDESGELDFFDFLCFQNEFAAGSEYADCDDSDQLDFFDFLCFQNEFAAGCP
jgi:hypothetical protein